MSDLLTRPLLRRDEPAWGSRVPWLASVLAAGWALVAGLALSVLPPVAVWISEGAGSPVADPVRFGTWIWLASHRVGLQVGDADFTFAPLGMTVLFVLLMYRSARWAAHQAGTATPKGMVAVIAPAMVLHALGAWMLAIFAGAGDVSAAPFAAAGVAALWALLAFGLGVVHETGYDEEWLERVAPEVRAALAGAAVALACLALCGVVLVVISTVSNAGQIGALADALDAGTMGDAVLAVGGAVLVPNAILWATSFALGPGFAVGTETVIAPDGVQVGIVPAVPALGALPSDVPSPWIWAVLLGPVLAGVVSGLLVYRRLGLSEEPLSIIMLAAGGSGAAASLAMSVLAVLSGGSVGAMRLATVGPVAWEVAAMTFLTVGVPAMVTVALLMWRQARSRASAVTSTDASVATSTASTSPGTASGAADTGL
ncbi:cell division protein PerM [Phytoactinopolyspora halotolerans]|uniref:Uncharacterized protein n=1 Tax=Phytoactinopolyspora halotolerans TaxID=1981512 RepID=A0A6L9S3X1_9ACTN|nr:DUF6350 family protein [Phytoactinopolyspora halotolerans]NED99530.1 hypothetical protein [Phytoactinopolyspora halotolerans]